MKGTTRSIEILIVYYSRFGVLKDIAEEIGIGVLDERGVEIGFLEVEELPLEEPRPGEDATAIALRRATTINRLALADALIVGAPAYFGSPASPLKRLFEDCATAGNPPVHDRSRPWHLHLFRDKVGAAFSSAATPHGGSEVALQATLTMLMHMGMLIVTPGQGEPILENEASPYGPTAIAGPDGNRKPTPADLRAARDLGRRVARVTTWLSAGRTVWERQHAGAPQAAGTFARP